MFEIKVFTREGRLVAVSKPIPAEKVNAYCDKAEAQGFVVQIRSL